MFWYSLGGTNKCFDTISEQALLSSLLVGMKKQFALAMLKT